MKTLATICLALIALAVDAQIPGTTTVLGPIAPSSTLDTFPSHLATYGKGSSRTVATLVARDAISDERREPGMEVYVEENEITYRLASDLESWVIVRVMPRLAVASIADLLALNTVELVEGTGIEVLGRSTPGDWGDSRLAIWTSGSTATTNEISVFALGSGRMIFHDVDAGVVRPQWAVNWSALDAGPAALAATKIAGTNGIVDWGGGTFTLGRVYVDSTVTKRGFWRGQSDIGAAEGGMFGDRTILKLKDSANTNLLVIDGQVTFTLQGLTFDGNKAAQTSTEDLVQIKGTSAYHQLWIDQTKFNNAKGRALAIYDRPQVYVHFCSFALNDGDALWGTNIVDFVSHGTLIGKNFASGFVGYNFTSLRLYTFDIFQNLGKNLHLECVPGYSGGFSELKDGRLQMSGQESLFLKGSFKVLDIANVLMERANADSAIPYWTNLAASGTYSTVKITTNSAGQYPREIRFIDDKFGFAESVATKFPKYHIENDTPASINIHTFRSPTWVIYATPVVSPVNGLGNFPTDSLDMDRASFFQSGTTPVTQRVMKRLTVSPTATDLNTNYTASFVGPIQIQETANPTRQWTVSPDLVTRHFAIKDETDGDPIFDMDGDAGFKLYVGGNIITETDTNGFRANGSGAIQLNVKGSAVSVSNQLSVATAPASGFPLTVRGPVLLENTSSPGSKQWALNPDQSSSVFSIKDNTDGDPALFGSDTGYFSFSASQGVVPPVMTQTQEDAATFPDNAVWVNTTLNELRRYKPGTGATTVGAGGGGGAVDSVFGRTGTVTAQSGDYSSAQITGLTEQIRDDIGTALVGTNGLAITADDAGDKILVGISGISSTLITGLDEQVRDTIGTALAAGSNIVITPNDGSDSITVGLATNVSLNQIDVTTLNAGTLNMATVAAGAIVGTNSLKVGTTTITDLNQLQPADADLTADAALSGTGLKVRTGAGTAATVSIVSGSSKVVVTGGNGASGNPTIDIDDTAIPINNLSGTLGSTKGGLGTNAVATKSLLVGNGSGPVKSLVGTNVLVYYGADGTPMVLGLGSNLSTDGTNLIAAGGGGGGGSITYNGTAVTNITSGPDIVGDVVSGNLTLRRPAPGTLTDGATISTVASNGVYFYTTVQGSRTLADPTSLVAGRQLTWEITQGTNMATTLTLGSAFKGSAEVPIPTDRNLILSTNAGHIHLIEGVVLSDGASVLLKTWRSGIN